MTALNQEKLDWVLRQLETMTAPDRSVDLAIHTLLYPEGDVAKLVQNRHGFDGQEGMAWELGNPQGVLYQKCDEHGRCFYNGGYALPNYTASLDAAMTLVPEGHVITSMQNGSLDHKYYDVRASSIWSVMIARDGFKLETVFDISKIPVGKASTGPCALTAASLRARAAQGEG